MKLRLSLVCTEYPRTRPILDGSVTAEGIELIPMKLHPAETFWRAFRYNEFDVTEMSLGSFVVAKSKENAPWLALPIFPCKIFFHTHVLCNIASGISKPQDLRGKKVGLAEYQMSAAVWLRGILEDEFGVRPQEISWFQERTDHRTPLKTPQGVSLSGIPQGADIHTMLLENDLDAILYTLHPEKSFLDKSSAPIHADRRIRPLFPDKKQEEARYYRKNRILPANHVLVVKKELLREHPWVARNLFTAFEKAKEANRRGLYDYSLTFAPDVFWQLEALKEQEEVFGPDPYVYGVSANRSMLEHLADYCYRQGLAERKVDVDELFAETLLDS